MRRTHQQPGMRMTGEGQAGRREVIRGLGGWAPRSGGTATSERGVVAVKGVEIGSAETWTVAVCGGRPRSRRSSWRCCCCCYCAAGWTPRQPSSRRRGLAPPVVTSAPVSGAVVFFGVSVTFVGGRNDRRKIIGWSYFDKMISTIYNCLAKCL